MDAMNKVGTGASLLLCLLIGEARGDDKEGKSADVDARAVRALIEQLGRPESQEAASKKLETYGYSVLPHLATAEEHKGTRLAAAAATLWRKIAGYDPHGVAQWGKPKPDTEIDRVLRLPKEVIHEETQIELVLVPPGGFMMGATAAVRRAAVAKGLHEPERQTQMHIRKPFYLGRYEVTQRQFMRIVSLGERIAWPGRDRPVNSVSIKRTRVFLAETGLRLPTEAEWEYACRGGLAAERYGKLDEIGWYQDTVDTRKRPGTQRVGQKKPNAFGLYDMLGNVVEWCSRSSGGYVLRGGAYSNRAIWLQASVSSQLMPADHASRDIGFRVARSLGP